MIGSTYKHRDGGWTISIHGSEADMASFQEFLQWLVGKNIELREGTEDTKRYENVKLLLEEFPDASAILDGLSEKIGGTRMELLCYAINLYQVAVEAVRRGEQIALLRGDEIATLKIDIPWIKPE